MQPGAPLPDDCRSDCPFLQGGDATAALIDSRDWSATPLGPIAQWPRSLKTALALVVRAPTAMALLWGPDGVLLYNDGYARICGARHPAALGSVVRDTWPQATGFNGKVLQAGLRGESLTVTDQPFTLQRDGAAQDAWFTLHCTPVLGDDDVSAGVLLLVMETTAQVQARQWQRDEPERMRRLFEQAPGFMAMLRGPQHVFEWVNPAYLQLVGFRDVLGKTVRDALPEIEGQGFYELLDRVFASGQAISGQTTPVHIRAQPDTAPQQRFIDFVYQPVRDGAGQVVGILVQGTDVTARVNGEQQASSSEARNRQILDSAIDYAIIAFDLQGRVTRWNEGARRILGWTEAEMLDNDAERIFTPEDVATKRMATEMQRALTQGVGNDERWHQRKSGERFWANGEMTPLRGDDGQATGFVKVLRDRTPQHQAAQALQQSEAMLRRAQEAGGVGTFSLDLQTNLLHVTAEFCRLYGLEPRDTYPADVLEALVLPEDRHLRSSAQTRRDQSAALKVEYRIRRAGDGQLRWLARSAEFEHDGDSGRAVRMVGAVHDITEQKAAQQALSDSAEQFRVFAQTLPNHAWIARPDGLLDWFNRRVHDYSGLQHDALHGSGWAQMVHPDDIGAASALWAASLGSGDAYETEFRLRRADGAYRWHLARALPLRAADGSITRWVGTNTDIHENKLAQAESRRDRNRIWTLSQELMLVCDYDGLIASVNPSATRLLGWLPAEMAGRKVADFLHPDDFAKTAAQGRELAAGRTTANFENRYRTKAGGWRLLDWTAVPDGGLIHAVARDITGERSAAVERERILDTTNDLIGTVGPDGLLGTINPAWQRMLGHTLDQMLDRPLADLIEPADLPLYDGLRERLLQGRGQRPGAKPVHVEFRLRRHDGRHALVAWSVQTSEEVLYLVGRNVTEQRAAEDALRQAQKMEAVGQLTGGIAHDFNNLLQGITGSLELVQKRIAQQRVAEADSHLGRAMGAARRAAALTHRLLAFSRRQPLDPKPLQANTLVASMDDLLRRTLGQRIQLQMVLAPQLWVTRCDPNQLENAILNLAINARDAMPDGGELVIETCNVSLDSEQASTHGAMQPGRYVCIAVTDTGAGMSADTMSKAFEPFFTTKPIGQGTGLGLSMIYGFARQSEGHARIDSELGRGTTLRLYLPQYAGAGGGGGDGAADDGAPPSELSAAHRSVAREVVLVVEDEPDIRELIVEVLSDLDYVALQAADGPQGLAVLQSDQRIDLLVTDIGLPGLNGSQLADAARLLRPGLQILFMTGYAENAAVSAGFLLPGMAMITKPFTMEAMAARIQDIVAGR